MTVFYANDTACLEKTERGDVHVCLFSASPFGFGESREIIMPPRVAEKLLQKLTEALKPTEPHEDAADAEQQELPLASVGDFGAEHETPNPANGAEWLDRFGVQS